MKTPNKITEFFDKLAIDRDEKIKSDLIVNYEQKMRQSALMKLLEIKQGELYLDAGCGNCRDAGLVLKHEDIYYVGIDISFSMLKEAKKRYSSKQMSIVRGDCLVLPFKNKTFDIVVCSEVLEHIPQWKDALKELKRVLKDKGILIISTPNTFSIYYPQKVFFEKMKGSKHPYDKWKNYWILKKELKKLGFSIVEVRGACYLPGLIAYKEKIKRLIGRFLPVLESIEKTILSESIIMKYFGYIVIIKAKSHNELHGDMK
jgi:ubiquinone/menaquinone biosynthesis C-methylase UbiE